MKASAAGPSPASATAPRNQTDMPVSKTPEAAAATANSRASRHGDFPRAGAGECVAATSEVVA
ncbi:MAG: hypothetical protein WB420_01510 [Bradyrhizobium sp.]